MGFSPGRHLHPTSFHGRFATANFAFWVAQLTFGQQDGIYINGYRASAEATGLISIFTVVASFGFLAVLGQLQDAEALSRWFPVEQWGRRAPWYLVHLLLTGPMLALVVNPPASTVCACGVVESFGNVTGEATVVVDCAAVLFTPPASVTSVLTGAGAGVEVATRTKCSLEDDDNQCRTDGTGEPWRDGALDLEQGCGESDICVPCGGTWTCNSTCTFVPEVNKTCGDGSVVLSRGGYCPEEACPGGTQCCPDGSSLRDGNGYCPENYCKDGSAKDTSLDRMFLTVYSLILLLALNWCTSAMNIATNSAIYEIFPFDSERMKVQGFMKLWFALVFPIGGIIAVPILFLGGPPSSPKQVDFSYLPLGSGADQLCERTH